MKIWFVVECEFVCVLGLSWVKSLKIDRWECSVLRFNAVLNYVMKVVSHWLGSKSQPFRGARTMMILCWVLVVLS